MDRYPYLGTLYYLTSVYLRRIGALFIFFCIFLIQNTNTPINTYSKLDPYGYGEKLERVRKALYKLFKEYSNKGSSTFMASCFSNVSQPPSIIRREREKLPTHDVSCLHMM